MHVMMPHGYSRHPSSANRSLGAFTHPSDGSAQNVSSHTGAHADTPHGCSGHPSGRNASLGTNLTESVAPLEMPNVPLIFTSLVWPTTMSETDMDVMSGRCDVIPYERYDLYGSVANL